MLAANSISHHRRPLVDYQNPRAAADALRDTSPCRYTGITARISKEDPAYIFDAYGNSIFGSDFK
jgi:hypothetical protein